MGTKRPVALVTGGARGLGSAITEQLAIAGFDVVVNYFASAERAQELCCKLEGLGARAKGFQADVRNEVQVERMVRQVEAELGPVEVLVVNATGPQPFLSIEEQTWESYLDQLNFFVKSPLLLVKAVLAGMKARGAGRIIQIGSEVFEKGTPRFSHYVTAKGAQLGQTRSWAMELAPYGITVNLVAPGWIPTERHADVPQSEMNEYIKGVPMGRMGEAEDVGRAVAYLAGEGGKFVTGQKISVNGGHSLA